MMNMADILIRSLPWTAVSVAQFREEFLAGAADTAPGTKRKYRQIFRLIESLGIETTDQLNSDMVGRIIATRPAGESPHSLHSVLMSLRAICYDAETRRYCDICPFRLRKMSKMVRVPRSAGKRHHSPEEMRAVFELMMREIVEKEGWAQWRARRIYALTATVAYTGTRAGEAQRLEVADIDLGGRLINLVPHTKHGRFKTEASAQPIAIPSALVPILSDWLTHRLDHPEGWRMPPAESIPWLFPGSKRRGPWTTGGPGLKPIERLRVIAARAGVARMTFKSLRRTWATRAEILGVPQALITRQCRHTDTETTREWYQQRDIDALRGAIDRFDY